jgi:hypothetical protein
MKTALLTLLTLSSIHAQTLSSVSDCYNKQARSHFCASKTGLSAGTVPKQGWCCPFGATDAVC